MDLVGHTVSQGHSHQQPFSDDGRRDTRATRPRPRRRKGRRILRRLRQRIPRASPHRPRARHPPQAGLPHEAHRRQPRLGRLLLGLPPGPESRGRPRRVLHAVPRRPLVLRGGGHGAPAGGGVGCHCERGVQHVRGGVRRAGGAQLRCGGYRGDVPRPAPTDARRAAAGVRAGVHVLRPGRAALAVLRAAAAPPRLPGERRPCRTRRAVHPRRDAPPALRRRPSQPEPPPPARGQWAGAAGAACGLRDAAGQGVHVRMREPAREPVVRGPAGAADAGADACGPGRACAGHGLGGHAVGAVADERTQRAGVVAARRPVGPAGVGVAAEDEPEPRVQGGDAGHGAAVGDGAAVPSGRRGRPLRAARQRPRTVVRCDSDAPAGGHAAAGAVWPLLLRRTTAVAAAAAAAAVAADAALPAAFELAAPAAVAVPSAAAALLAGLPVAAAAALAAAPALAAGLDLVRRRVAARAQPAAQQHPHAVPPAGVHLVCAPVVAAARGLVLAGGGGPGQHLHGIPVSAPATQQRPAAAGVEDRAQELRLGCAEERGVRQRHHWRRLRPLGGIALVGRHAAVDAGRHRRRRACARHVVRPAEDRGAPVRRVAAVAARADPAAALSVTGVGLVGLQKKYAAGLSNLLFSSEYPK